MSGGGYESIYRFAYQGKKFTRSLEVTSTRDKGLILVSRSSPIGSKSAMDEKVLVIDIPKAEKAKLIEALTNNQLNIKF